MNPIVAALVAAALTTTALASAAFGQNADTVLLNGKIVTLDSASPAAEALAVRERVGLMDISTFAKFEVTGPDAHAFLERICANRIPAKDGGIILGHLLNENGFIESELTVTRLAADPVLRNRLSQSAHIAAARLEPGRIMAQWDTVLGGAVQPRRAAMAWSS